MLRSNQELGAVDENDDGVPGLPPLDGGAGDAEDGFLDDEPGLNEAEGEFGDGLEVGLEDDAHDWLTHVFEDASLSDPEHEQDVEEFMDGSSTLAEREDQRQWSEDDMKPAELAEEPWSEALPSISMDDGEGLEHDATDEAGLSPLPPLQAEDEVEQSDEAWLSEVVLPPLPLNVGEPAASWMTIAPGVRWQTLPGVTLHEVAGLDEPSELSVWASLPSGPLVYQRGLYRLGAQGFSRFGGLGLEGDPRALVAALADGLRLWAIGAGYVQFSDDGGLTFGPPVMVEDGATLKTAMTAEGSVWIAHHGGLLRCRPGELFATKVPCNLRIANLASDGGKNLVVLAEDGRLHLSCDGARSFRYLASWEGTCQELLMRGEVVVVVTADGSFVRTDGGFREVFGVSSHALQLSQEQGGAVVYGCVLAGDSWLLTRMPVASAGRRPVVISRLPVHLGAPRFLAVTAAAEQVTLLVGLDHGFLRVQVPCEQE